MRSQSGWWRGCSRQKNTWRRSGSPSSRSSTGSSQDGTSPPTPQALKQDGTHEVTLPLLATAFAALALAPLAALAHPSLQTREAQVGAPYRAVINIPHGCDGSATVRVRVLIPEGVIGVKPMPKPGWTISTVRGPYARSYPYYHGQTLTEGVKEIVWSGRLPDDYFDDFVFAGVPGRHASPAGQKLLLPDLSGMREGRAAWTECRRPDRTRTR